MGCAFQEICPHYTDLASSSCPVRYDSIPSKRQVVELDSSNLSLVLELMRSHQSVRDFVRSQLVNKEWQVWYLNNRKVVSKEHQLRDWYFPTGLLEAESPGKSKWSGVHHPSMEEGFLPALDFLRYARYTFLRGAASGLVLVCKPSDPNLILCNPLTKKWRELPYDPKADPRSTLRFIHIVANDASNTYEVVIISNNLSTTYNSQSNEWISSSCPFRGKLLGSICSNGRIYVLDRIDKRYNIVVIRVYLIEARQWLPDVYTLLDPDTYAEFFPEQRQQQIRSSSLVACMGDIYAIVPELIEKLSPDEQTRRKPRMTQFPWFKMEVARGRTPAAVRFHLFKLQEESSRFAVCTTLRSSRVPLNAKEGVWTDVNLYPYMWYLCAAKGNVLWLACRIRLLGFEVRNGRCLKRMKHEFSAIPLTGNLAPYKPNFHVEP